jgi:hypothetical protein
MKIAVCFSGQFRTAKECAPNLKAFFSSDKHEIDFFIHTWDNTSYKNFNGANIYPQRDRNITEQEIEFLKQTYNPKAIKIESHSEYLKKFVEKGFGSGLELWYSFYKSISLKKLYERKYNFNYDIVIKVRLDCMFKQFDLDKQIEHIIKYPQNTIATHFRYDLNWKNILNKITANDICFISSSETMEKYANFFIDKRIYDKLNNPIECKNDGYGYTQHMHTFYKNIEVINMLTEPFVLRYAYKHLAKQKLNIDILSKMEKLDGFYYNYYKNQPHKQFYIHTIFDKEITNYDDMDNKVYLNEINLKTKFI